MSATTSAGAHPVAVCSLSLAAVVVDAIPEAIVASLAQRIVLVNPSAQRLFGYRPAELTGLELELLMPDYARRCEDLGLLLEPPERSSTVVELPIETLGRGKGGSTFVVTVSRSGLRTEDGLLLITSFQKVEGRDHLDHSSARLAAIIRSSFDAIVGKDTDGVITTWNPGAERLLGYSAHEIVGKNVSILIPESHLEREAVMLSRIADGQVLEPFDTLRRHRDGGSIEVSVTLSPILDAGGRIDGISSIAHDITGERRATRYARELNHAILNILDDFGAERDQLDDTQRATLNILADIEDERATIDRVNLVLRDEIAQRVAAERTLMKSTADLMSSNEELAQFAYVASHDLQEPLRKVSAFCQLLARRYQGQLDDNADVYIGYVVDGAARMQLLINDLLSFARVGKSGTEPGPVDTQRALESAIENLSAAIAETGAEVLVLSPMPIVFGEDSRMIQLFQNLLGNAIKFHGADAPRIEVEARKAGNLWTISVADNGIGIEPQYHDRVFAVFQRLHARDEYPGTGIGLAISKKIVEQMGGRIWPESVPGRGTTFFCEIPAHED